MKDLLKLLALQFVAAVGIYLLLFLFGEALASWGWLLLISGLALFLFHKKSKGGPWWWEKGKRKLLETLSHLEGK